jgi:hypothetical protein
MDRRQFLGSSVAGVGAVVSGPMWRAAHVQEATPGAGPYGSIEGVSPDGNGLVLPEGFTSRVIATSDSVVGGTDYIWHVFPDGGATFATGDGDDGGWIYVSNSEAILPGTGGASAVRFDADANVIDAYRILGGTTINCAGGPTPWGTWLSCEEFDWHGNDEATEAFGSVAGRVFETDPTGEAEPILHSAMGLFQHEAAAVDPVNEWVYMTEDQADGCLYRYIPDAYPDLSAGRLEVAVLEGDAVDGQNVSWLAVPDPSAAEQPTKDQVSDATGFPGGEGLWYHDGTIVFTTKGDNRIHALETTSNNYRVIYDAEALGESTPLRGVDNITVEAGSGDLYVAEDGDDMQVVIVTPAGVVAPFAQVMDQDDSEVTGPAFSPDGTRLYFSSQRGSDGRGITYEVTGPFRGASTGAAAASTTTTTSNPADTIESAAAAKTPGDSGDDGSALPVVAGGAAVAAAIAAGAAVLARRNRGSTDPG